MFDNRGTDGVYGPSRLLMIDIANGQETTVFPNSSTPAKYLHRLQRTDRHFAGSTTRTNL